MKNILIIVILFGVCNRVLCQVHSDSFFLNYKKYVTSADRKYIPDTLSIALAEQLKEEVEHFDLVKYFSEYPKNQFNYSYGGRQYSYNELQIFTDILLSEFSKNITKVKKRDYVDLTFQKNKQLLKYVEIIDNLPKDKHTYFNTADSLWAEMKSLNTIDKIYAVEYFNRHFYDVFDSVDLIKIALFQATELSRNEPSPFREARCLMAIGDCFARYGQIAESLEPYCKARYIFDSLNSQNELGHIESRLGALFAGKDDYYYVAKSHKHYLQGADAFYRSKDTVNYATCYFNDAMNYMYLYGLDSNWGANYLLYYTYNFGHKHRVLNSTQKVVNYSNSRIAFLSALGAYFERQGNQNDIRTAIKFYHAGLITSISDYEHCLISEVYTSLINLAYAYSHLSDRATALKYIDSAIKYSLIIEDHFWTKKLQLAKAKVYGNLQEADSSIKWVNKSIDLSDQDENLPLYTEYSYLKRKAYEYLRDLYASQKMYDSSNHYNTLYNNEISQNLQEIQTISEIESFWESYEHDNRIAQKDNTIKQIIIWGGSLIIITLGIIVAGYNIRVKRKNDILIYTKSLLSSTAKAKLHDIRNNYTSFINLIDTSKYESVRNYAENSAYYFSQTLDVGDNDLWTIAQELKLMSAFYDAERIIKGGVTLPKPNFNDIDIDITLCMPEMFSTILHNAMKHAFKDKSGERIFSISAKHTEKLIVYEFVDNGISGEVNSYFSRPGSGLSILRERVQNKLLLSKMKEEAHDCVTASVGSNGLGTVIKVKLPYEFLS